MHHGSDSPLKAHKSGRRRSKFVSDKHFAGYTKPNMIEAAQTMLCDEKLTEEGFLGAQAVLILNGIL